MNIGIISDVTSNKKIGAIAVDKEMRTVAYITKNEMLLKTLDIFTQAEYLDILITEYINSKIISRIEQYSITDPLYLVALNYNLPHPWRILGLKNVDGIIEEVIEDCYKYIVEEEEK